MPRLRILVAVLLAALAMGHGVQARDIALVLSNADDRKAWFNRGASGYLDLLQALRQSGFDLQVLENADMAATRDVLALLARQIDTADRVVVVLDGAFVSAPHDSWLLAEGVSAPRLTGVHNAGVSISTMAALLSRRSGRALMVLSEQAGPATGFGLGAGVAGFQTGQGVSVFHGPANAALPYATGTLLAPGATFGRLARALPEGITATGYLPQYPSFGGATGAAVSGEEGFWAAVQAINSEEAYKAYLQRFANGPHAQAAQSALAALAQTALAQARATENALQLSRDDKRAIQSNLTLLGFDTRGIDGLFGSGSRAAIARWQEQTGFAPNAYLTGQQVALLAAQAAPLAEARAEEEREADEAYWQATGATATRAGLEAYLDRYPTGLYAEEAKSGLAEFEAEDQAQGTTADVAAIAAAQEAESRVLPNPVARLLAEQRLIQLGFRPGVPDGRLDNNARAAIAEFQDSRGLLVTGYIDSETASRLLSGN